VIREVRGAGGERVTRIVVDSDVRRDRVERKPSWDGCRLEALVANLTAVGDSRILKPAKGAVKKSESEQPSSRAHYKLT
jgi:hypothetical protein